MHISTCSYCHTVEQQLFHFQSMRMIGDLTRYLRVLTLLLLTLWLNFCSSFLGNFISRSCNDSGCHPINITTVRYCGVLFEIRPKIYSEVYVQSEPSTRLTVCVICTWSTGIRTQENLPPGNNAITSPSWTCLVA
jgi:hypothetical protein